jgi:hypothetical protein
MEKKNEMRGGRTDSSEQIAGGEDGGGLMELSEDALVATVPPLRGQRAADGAKEKAGHSGRDDGVGEESREEKRARDFRS